MDFADFLKAAAPVPPLVVEPADPPWSPPGLPVAAAAPAPATPAKPSMLDASIWPIAVYQAIGDGIPGEPFVAYPLIPRKGGGVVAIRCCGPTAEAAKDKAREWIAAEIAKLQKAEERAKRYKKQG